MALYAIKVKYRGTWWACFLEEADNMSSAYNQALDSLAALGVDRVWMDRYDLLLTKVEGIRLEGAEAEWLVS